MRPNESGITRAGMSHTIGSLNDLRIFVARSSTDSIMCDTIRKRSKACSIPFFELDVELFMRGYIGHRRKLRISDRGRREEVEVPQAQMFSRSSWCGVWSQAPSFFLV